MIPCLHDTAGCQTGLTTGLTTVLNEQLFVQPVVRPDWQPPVVRPDWQPVWQPCWTNSHCSFNRLSTGLYNRFDNWLYTRYSRLSNQLSNGFDNRLNVCIHDTTGCETVWQPVWEQVVSCKRGLMTTRLRACVPTNGAHFQHTLWLSICFLCILDELCFTPRLMQ